MCHLQHSQWMNLNESELNGCTTSQRIIKKEASWTSLVVIGCLVDLFSAGEFLKNNEIGSPNRLREIHQHTYSSYGA